MSAEPTAEERAREWLEAGETQIEVDGTHIHRSPLCQTCATEPNVWILLTDLIAAVRRETARAWAARMGELVDAAYLIDEHAPKCGTRIESYDMPVCDCGLEALRAKANDCADACRRIGGE